VTVGAARSSNRATSAWPPPSPTPDLTDAEYADILERLGRTPNELELGMLAAMWSEHCGYKNSRALLKRLPTEGPRVVQGPGENAGAVDVGDGLLVVLKMESHNHPSAVEPFQGAATGVGGIIRDVFTMGARPVALLDSLRFGPLDVGRNRYLFDGVVAGIAHYGNCIGIPTVGGEIFFDPSFSGNPLVNAMCVGLVTRDRLIRARAGDPGDVVLVVGAATGRDGIHGATFASAELDDASEERRPAVQVGNPFLEKLLLEACLELRATDVLTAMQDLGAAGLTSSGVEVAARGGRGMRIDVARVSRREVGMQPYEVMLSESQERMLLVAPPGAVEAVRAHFDRWELHSDVVGEITDDGRITVFDGDDLVGELPIGLLTDDVPSYVREGTPRPSAPPPDLPPLEDVNQTLLGLLASPTVASRASVFQRYDHTVQANTVVEPGFGAAVVRIRGTRKALALTTDCNPRYCAADPRRGAAIAVAEAARNLACRGAEPLAVTDCLNFGNPERAEVYWELSEAIDGLGEACRALEVPIVSGNVSLYNETNGVAVAPSPIVGMVGLVEDVAQVVGSGFRAEGDAVLLLGPPGAELGCSEYLGLSGAANLGPPPALDLDLERRVQLVCRLAARRGLLASAHDCSEGGLAVALAESCIPGGFGFQGDFELLSKMASPTPRNGTADGNGRPRLDELLFGEGQSRIVVSCPPSAVAAILDVASAHAVPTWRLGTVGGDRLTWGDTLDLAIEEVTGAWTNGL
jgi:phosphoribosylformylglycinamidine synthase II